MMVAVCFACLTASAQVYVGGGLGFSKISDGDNDATAFEILPEVGYQLNDKWAVAVQLGYINAEVGETETSTFTIAPYARYTIATWNKVNLFADGQIQYVHTDVDDLKTNAWGLGILPGIKVDITDNLSLVSRIELLSYASAKADVDGAESVNTFTFNMNTTDLQFSLYYNF